MAIGSLPEPPRVAKPKPPPSEALIERQLRRTERQVRLVDLAAALSLWAAALLAALLALAVCDHWVLPIGTAGRWLALVTIVAATGYYVAAILAPLVVRRINSAYAAKVIEDAEPSLKNSLLNFLLLRNHRAAMPEAVVDALRDRAANDLQRTPIEHVVDRAPLIRLGYVLCGVMAVFAAYKLLSPKDPFRTVARVLAPWADIARPSRIQITQVTPGNAEVYQGQRVTITAEVQGAKSADQVQLLQSTPDGQSLDAATAMTQVSGVQYTVSLPVAGNEGLQQDVLYRVRAGDAESAAFRLHLLPSPRIDVERVELHFPAYTQRSPQSLVGQGDIRAVEGTRAVVFAKSNQTIRSAYVEFDPLTSRGGKRIATQAMEAEGTSAHTEFRLERLRDGSPRYASYQLRLLNEANLTNDRPTLYRLEPLADLTPEIEVLTPTQRRIELAADRVLKVELRGRDPDFGLCGMQLELASCERTLESPPLFESEAGALGPQNASYVVSPRKLGLVPGDDLTLVGIARDNRHNAAGQPEPNEARTERYVIHITAPEESAPERDGNDAAADKPEKQDGDAPDKSSGNKRPNIPDYKPPQAEKKPSKRGDKPADDEPGDSNTKQDKQNSKSQGGAGGSEEQEAGNKSEQKQQKSGNQGGGAGQSQEGGEQSSQESEGSEGAGGQSQSVGKQRSNSNTGGNAGGSEGSESGDDGTEGNSSGSAGQRNKPGKSSRTKPEKPEGNSSGGGSEGERSSDGPSDGDPNAHPSDSAGSDQPAGDQRSGAGSGEGAGQRPKHDGEVFEQLQRELAQEQRKQSGAGASSDSSSGKSPQNKAGESGNQGSTGTERTRPQEGTTGQQERSSAGAESSTEGGKQNGPKQRLGDASGNNAGKPGDQATAEQNSESAGGTQGNKPEAPMTSDDASSQGGSQSENSGDAGSSEKPGTPMQGGAGKPDDRQGNKSSGRGKQGDPGSANKPEQNNPSGEAQTPSQDRNKSPESGQGDTSNESGSAPSQSKKQSNSTGGQSGTESGGGNRGAGQQGNASGNDAPGGSTAGEEGAGRASEPGKGETGSQAGRDQTARGKTGESGNQQGAGSKSQPGEQGSKPDANAPGNKSGAGNSPQAGRPKDASQSKGGSGAGPVTGGGVGSDEEPVASSQAKVEVADTEAENLQYAKKSTDLALKYLKDQKDHPDPELLKRMGWTKDDLNAFVDRWEALKRSAKEGDEAKNELDDAYRSLGLRPAADQRRAASGTNDAARGLRDAGARSEPPSAYSEQFKAFRKGVGRGSDAGRK
jgi:hypothetical protein